jgi:hypothetical protein
MVLVVQMTTVFQDCTTEEQRSIVRLYFWAKGLNATDIHKEMFPVYGGKCLSPQAVHNLMANVLLMMMLKRRCRSAETKVKRLLMLRVSTH